MNSLKSVSMQASLLFLVPTLLLLLLAKQGWFSVD